jgi:hypothetical protein
MAWRSHHGALTEFEQRHDPVVEREKALRRERHGHQELRGDKEVITALFALNKVR